MLGAIKLTDLATLGLLEQATSGWIWSETGAQTRHTAERWPAPGTHAGSYLRTVQLAKDIDKVAGSLQAIDLDVDLVLGLSPCTCKSETGTLTHNKLQRSSHFSDHTQFPGNSAHLLCHIT